MPVLIPLTNAAHGGVHSSCGTHGNHDSCGVNCDCGCPYTGMVERNRIELIADIEREHPNQWLGLVIPPDEDEYAPERAMLVVHSDDDNEVWDAVQRITFNQVVHVYFNGDLDQYLLWVNTSP